MSATVVPGFPDRHVPRVSQGVLWAVIGVWLAGAAGAFWYFELRLERPFVSKSPVTLFESGAAAAEAEDWYRRNFAADPIQPAASPATVVHVYDAQCPCNRFTEPHLAKMEASYRRRDVRFLRVERSSRIGTAAPRWIEATPAALVFDAQGKLIYFGPYSEGAACGTSNGLVERVLNRVLAGEHPRPGLVISGGCFCTRKT